MDSKNMQLKEIIGKVKTNEILLPDFQRGFVWTDVEMQRSLAASVLAKLPLGNILLLATKNPNEYACKILGSKKKVLEQNLSTNSEVSFLLDGQQRITVLTNIFSDIIFLLNEKVSDLISESLKRRFFIKFPAFYNLTLNDPFGLWNFNFPEKDATTKEPSYLSGDMLPIIDYIPFYVSDDDKEKPYNPYNEKSMKYNQLSIHYDQDFPDCYAVPLFLLGGEPTNTSKFYKLITEVAKKVLEDRIELAEKLLGVENDDNKKEFDNVFRLRAEDIYSTKIFKNDGFEVNVKEFIECAKKDDTISGYLSDFNETSDIKELFNSYVEGLTEASNIWVNQVKDYLKDCLDSINLKELILQETERNRAIDIFENMNKGGVKLNIFDLIMARVAIKSNIPYNDRLKEFIKKGKDLQERDNNCCFKYHSSLCSEPAIKAEFEKIQDNFIASYNIKCLDSKEINIAPRYKEQFLNVLSLLTYKNEYITAAFLNGSIEEKGFKIDVLKEDKKLQMKPENIDNYCRPTCVALDRAFYFFQVRCGIREINEINYALMIPLVAYILHEDKFYDGEKAEKVFNLLEAWYWASIFSGSYDRNQNTVMMSDLNHLIINANDIVNNKVTNLDWLKERINRILNAERFSEKNFMVHEKASIGEYPKKVMQSFVCQYYLTKGYYDLIEKTDSNNNKTIEQINVFSPSSNQLEMHHVIALGAVNSVNQSSKSLRKNPAHYLNSPLNMLYISKDANKEISAKSLQDYSSAIPTQSNLSLVGFTQTDLDYNATEEKKIESLKKRHENLQAEMTRETLNLISGL